MSSSQSSKSTGTVPPRPGGRRAGTGKPSVNKARVSARQASQARHRRNVMVAVTAVVVVVVVVVVLVVVKLSSNSKQALSPGETPAPSYMVNQVEGIPAGVLLAAAESVSSSSVTPPKALPANTPPLTSGGKPQILYMGAEYCPYCAAERWSMVMALSKFGTFTNLGTVTSSALSTEVNPSTPTFSFYGSTYSSQYIDFQSVEMETNQPLASGNGYVTLQKPTAAQKKIFDTYDAAPYTSSAGSIPFIDFGGKSLVVGAEYDASALSKMPLSQAVTTITSGSNTTSRSAQAVGGHLIATICKMISNKAPVCSQVPSSLESAS